MIEVGNKKRLGGIEIRLKSISNNDQIATITVEVIIDGENIADHTSQVSSKDVNWDDIEADVRAGLKALITRELL